MRQMWSECRFHRAMFPGYGHGSKHTRPLLIDFLPRKAKKKYDGPCVLSDSSNITTDYGKPAYQLRTTSARDTALIGNLNTAGIPHCPHLVCIGLEGAKSEQIQSCSANTTISWTLAIVLIFVVSHWYEAAASHYVVS